MKNDNWFEVSKAGLSQAFGENSFTSLMFELIQNAWDASAENVDVGVEFKGRRAAFYVTDDGCGISDLAAIYTVFGKSTSKDNPEKRGRFCIGDKLVLSRCESANVTSTSGSVFFDEDGRRKGSLKRERGTMISGTIRCTRAEFDEFINKINLLIAPDATKLILNGQHIVNFSHQIAKFNAILPTIIVNSEGELKKGSRETQIQLLGVANFGQPMIFEMGIPVCEASCPYHVNIGQKVPLSMDREKLPESFLKTLHALVLNATAELLDAEQIKAAWVAQATSSKVIDKRAMETFLDKRFGEDRVAFDPSDREANNRSVAKGYTLVTGGSLTGEQWDNAKRFELVAPAGQVFPTPKPFHPDGKPLSVIDKQNYTDEQCSMDRDAVWLAKALLNKNINVVLTDDAEWRSAGAYGNDVLYINVLSHPVRNERWLDLIIHEFGHEFSGNHLSDDYYKALTMLGAKLAKLVYQERRSFEFLGK